MIRRSRAREVALQLLFQRDLNPGVPRETVERFARERLREDAELVPFAIALLDGAVAHLAEIDAKLSAAAENWRLARMTVVDRNVLRLGAYELLFAAETPAAVVLDEAIELARRYGSQDSSAFVNGVLDRIADSCGRKDEPKGKGAAAINAEPEPEGDDSDEDGADDDAQPPPEPGASA